MRLSLSNRLLEPALNPIRFVSKPMFKVQAISSRNQRRPPNSQISIGALPIFIKRASGTVEPRTTSFLVLDLLVQGSPGTLVRAPQELQMEPRVTVQTPVRHSPPPARLYKEQRPPRPGWTQDPRQSRVLRRWRPCLQNPL